MEEEAAARLRPEMPLLGSDPLPEEVQEGEEVDSDGSVRERAQGLVNRGGGPVGGKKKKAPKWEESVVTREVRTVQGTDEDGAEQVWFYVPENTGDASKTKRKGWWLHEEQNSRDRYYIGPLEDIQQNKHALITDLAKCDAFPFKRVIQIDDKGQEVSKTERCITDNELSVRSLLDKPITDLTPAADKAPAHVAMAQDAGQGPVRNARGRQQGRTSNSAAGRGARDDAARTGRHRAVRHRRS
jgi:hypothetical protein